MIGCSKAQTFKAARAQAQSTVEDRGTEVDSLLAVPRVDTIPPSLPRMWLL